MMGGKGLAPTPEILNGLKEWKVREGEERNEGQGNYAPP